MSYDENLAARAVRGWLHVDIEKLRSPDELAEWVIIGVAAAHS